MTDLKNDSTQFEKNQKLGKWIVSIFFLLIISGLLMRHYYDKKLAKDPHAVTCVEIEGIYFRRGGIFIEFGYMYNKVKYHTGSGNEASISDESYHQYKKGNQHILIVFLKSDPRIHEILENDDDCKKFNIVSIDTTDLKCQDLIFNAAMLELGPPPPPPSISMDTAK